MKTFKTVALLFALPMLLVGCTDTENQDTYDWLTRGPYNYDAVGGCWFDNDTTVIRGETVETLCDVRSRGEEISCRDMCFNSVFDTNNSCGNVSRCDTLLWVEEDNALAVDTGCWTCADGCFTNLDRSVTSYEECRPVEEVVEEAPAD